MTNPKENSTVFHERISILKKQGYRGFTVSKINKEWNGVQVTVQNDSGKVITTSGETNEEAYKKAIDNIDLVLEEM